MTKKPIRLSDDTLLKLSDPGYQRGIAWRWDKLSGILEALEQGKPEDEIRRILLASGVTPGKARELIQTAKLSKIDDAETINRMKDAAKKWKPPEPRRQPYEPPDD